MPDHQPEIFDQSARYHEHLEFDLSPGATPADVRAALRALRAVLTVRPVVGVGAALMRRLAPDVAPAELADLAPIHGTAGTMPVAPHDVWLWLQAASPDVLVEEARVAIEALAPALVVVEDQPAFVYRDHRDLTGFVDGTENPAPDEAADVALVPDGPAAGGSFALVQRWRHQLTPFLHLPQAEQEAVIGRTKPDSVELEDLPATSHVSRMVVEEDGEELAIWRRSAPWGNGRAHGLQFIAFSAQPHRFVVMLERMYGAAPDGVADRLLDFSRPETGALYFCPAPAVIAAWTA